MGGSAFEKHPSMGEEFVQNDPSRRGEAESKGSKVNFKSIQGKRTNEGEGEKSRGQKSST